VIAQLLNLLNLLIVACLAGAPEAHDVRIHWSGPSECEGERGMVERLEVLSPELSIAPVSTGEAETPALVTVRVTVSTIDRGPDLQWSVELELDSPQGREHRTFVAESCAVAIDATALVLAVAVDPVEVAARLEREAQIVPSPPEAPPARESPPPAIAPLTELADTHELDASQPLPNTDERWRGRFGIAILGGGGYGPLRAGSATLMGRLALIGPRWRWSLHGAWLPPLRPALGDRGRARVDGFLLGTRGCGLLFAGPVEFPLCAGLEAGAIRARALDPIQNPETASQPYLGLLLGPGLSWAPISRLALGLEVEAMIPLVFGGFALDGQPALDNLPVGVRALASVEVRIPSAAGPGRAIPSAAGPGRAIP
jgi:hypothetical protein